MQRLRVFINNSLTKHVSGTTTAILRSARPYIAAHGFQHILLTVHTTRVPVPQGSSQQHQLLETICGSIQSGTPEDWHSGARNMLS